VRRHALASPARARAAFTRASPSHPDPAWLGPFAHRLGRLQALNQNPVANKSEIQKIVESLGRSFGKVDDYDFPGTALGYTGKINRAKKDRS